jgi:hypothetical protein
VVAVDRATSTAQIAGARVTEDSHARRPLVVVLLACVERITIPPGLASEIVADDELLICRDPGVLGRQRQDSLHHEGVTSFVTIVIGSESEGSLGDRDVGRRAMSTIVTFEVTPLCRRA